MKLIVVSLLATLFCISAGSEDAKQSTDCPVKAGHGKYAYDSVYGVGPNEWGKLPGYKMCGKGKRQSPIDFPLKTENIIFKPLKDGPATHMKPALMEFTPTVENWAMACNLKKFGACGDTVYRKKKYGVISCHFHSPSEHLLDGKQYPLESHIVHKAKDGSLLVVSTMFDYPSKETYSGILHSKRSKFFGTNPTVSKFMSVVLNNRKKLNTKLGGFMTKREGYCTYVGSLTTPPCTEKVRFIMQLGIQTITEAQVNQYAVSVGRGVIGNNRPIQPLNGRKITCFV